LVRPKPRSATVRFKDGDGIKFRKGDSGDDAIDLPDSRVCNLHVAVARVAAASGLAPEVFDECCYYE
jgi:hypothetical protein